MLYAVRAYEQIYGGLYGMHTNFVMEADPEQEVENEAVAASIEVMSDYSSIMEDIYEQASEEYEVETDEWWDLVSAIQEENVAYGIYPIVNTKGKTLEELDEEFCNDPDGFIETYCLAKRFI